MFFEPEQDGNARPFKRVTVRDIIKKIYVKIGGRKIPVFLYCFKSPQGHYQLWFWDTVPEIRQFVEVFSKQGAAYIWHRCRLWGWEQAPLKRLFMASFNSTTATSAMNSKWCAKRRCVVQIQMTAEAAAEFNFGNSPFVLKEGEDKASRQKREKGVIQRGNIRPEEIGGVDADDLYSVGDVSNAETIFVSEEDDDDYEEYDDDEVSMMSENEGFEDEGDESTVQPDDSGSDEEEDSEMSDNNEDEEDSAFATKAGLDDLAARGRKVRGDSAEQPKCQGKQMGEKASAREQENITVVRQDLAKKAKEMEDILARLKVKEDALNEALNKAGVNSEAAAPGVAGKEAQGGQAPQDASTSGAPAAVT